MDRRMGNLATPAEMVEDILNDPVLLSRISADGFIGLLKMAREQEEKEKTVCGKQTE